jgi:hypothetical protein
MKIQHQPHAGIMLFRLKDELVPKLSHSILALQQWSAIAHITQKSHVPAQDKRIIIGMIGKHNLVGSIAVLTAVHSRSRLALHWQRFRFFDDYCCLFSTVSVTTNEPLFFHNHAFLLLVGLIRQMACSKHSETPATTS